MARQTPASLIRHTSRFTIELPCVIDFRGRMHASCVLRCVEHCWRIPALHSSVTGEQRRTAAHTHNIRASCLARHHRRHQKKAAKLYLQGVLYLDWQQAGRQAVLLTVSTSLACQPCELAAPALHIDDDGRRPTT